MTSVNLNGNTVPVYPTLSDFPASAAGGSLAVTYDTNIVYEFDAQTNMWIVVGPGAGGGGGTVTSVGLTAAPIFTVGGSPVTSAGNLDLELANENSGTVFAAPTSGSGAPTFRALTQSDLPLVYKVNEFVLSNTDISNKYVTLSEAPLNPSLTVLDVIGGPTQQYGVDYTVSGSTLSWSSLGLQPILDAGDNLVVQFY